MKIPFSPPRIDDKTVASVTEALRSGWVTTGPRTKAFEKQLASYCGSHRVLCVSSATAGLELILRWFGIGPGDEVIVPAYTYCATANVVVHCGATPIMVDVLDDFTMDPEKVRQAISEKTKAIIPVDIGGWPCDYASLFEIANDRDVREKFKPSHANQENLGRVLILADAAHSFGALSGDRKSGTLADISVFSFHAVKNLTTAEGGAISLSLPDGFDADEVYSYLCTFSLHGQNKDALAKSQGGQWRYDVTEAGYKCNMTDIQAAIGLVELERYEETLMRRKQIFDRYTAGLSGRFWARCPVFRLQDRESSYHVYMLRIAGITEAMRDAIIQRIMEHEVAVNVHFIPLPLLTYYRNQGYRIEDFPASYDHFSREISLPVYYDLTDDQVQTVLSVVIREVEKVLSGNKVTR